MDISTIVILGGIFIIGGWLLWIKTPSKNGNVGFKSPTSLKNEEMWIAGNKLCGKLMLTGGATFIPVAIILQNLMTNYDMGAKISVISLFLYILLSFLITESHLRKVYKNQKQNK